MNEKSSNLAYPIQRHTGQELELDSGTGKVNPLTFLLNSSIALIQRLWNTWEQLSRTKAFVLFPCVHNLQITIYTKERFGEGGRKKQIKNSFLILSCKYLLHILFANIVHSLDINSLDCTHTYWTFVYSSIYCSTFYNFPIYIFT